jgi:hypothetical protein
LRKLSRGMLPAQCSRYARKSPPKKLSRAVYIGV